MNVVLLYFIRQEQKLNNHNENEDNHQKRGFKIVNWAQTFVYLKKLFRWLLLSYIGRFTHPPMGGQSLSWFWAYQSPQKCCIFVSASSQSWMTLLTLLMTRMVVMMIIWEAVGEFLERRIGGKLSWGAGSAQWHFYTRPDSPACLYPGPAPLQYT